MLKDANLTLVELQTLLCQIEAYLNLRFFTQLSSSLNDLENYFSTEVEQGVVPLAPPHFLIGGPMIMHPVPDLVQAQQNCLRRCRFVKFLMQSF